MPYRGGFPEASAPLSHSWILCLPAALPLSLRTGGSVFYPSRPVFPPHIRLQYCALPLLPLLQRGGIPAPSEYRKAPEAHPHTLCFHMSQPALPLFHVHEDSGNASAQYQEPFLRIPERPQSQLRPPETSNPACFLPHPLNPETDGSPETALQSPPPRLWSVP